MIQIIDKVKCCGCNACIQICPKHCITQYEDNEGFVYPNVDMRKCVQCGLCRKVCPILHLNKRGTQYRISYAAKSKDDSLRLNSSSGGIFSVLAKVIIQHNGKVYGAKFTDDNHVTHFGVSKYEEISLFNGAKYVQSNTNITYIEVESYLKLGIEVLYSGTPCQIAGLKTFLRKDYENLYTIELICHGVPSYKVFSEFLKEQSFDNNLQILSFRDKRFGWTNYCMSFKYKNIRSNENIRYILNKDNIFMKSFLSDLYLRPSCYLCFFKNNRSGADITLGDFWGIQEVLPNFYDEKGISAVLINTFKGRVLFDLIKKDILYTEVNYQDIYRKNNSLEKNAYLHPWRDYFFRRLGKEPFSAIIYKIQHPSVWMRVVRKFMSC